MSHQSFYNEYLQDSFGRPTFQVPSWQVRGELGLKLTANGRLLFFRLPPLEVSQVVDASDADSLPWAEWFREETTGFMLAVSEQVSSDPGADTDAVILTVVSDKSRTTPDASDAVRIWHGVDHRVGNEVYVVAAAFRGRPVYYEVFTTDEFESCDSGIARFGIDWIAVENCRERRVKSVSCSCPTTCASRVGCSRPATFTSPSMELQLPIQDGSERHNR